MVLLLMAAAAAAEVVRASRLAMGTVVGIAVVAPEGDAPPVRAAIEAAYAAVEAGEAEVSEWRPGSATARIGRGEAVPLAGPADALYTWLLALRAASGGAFDAGWRSGGSLVRTSEGWRATGALDLGGVLKGWLVDRAVAALRAAGREDFLVDAAGDLYAAGDDGVPGRGWRAEVWDGTRAVAVVRLRDEALSTSGNAGQPGHVSDARTGAPVTGDRLVSVVAPDGATADGLATALFAGADPAIAPRHGASAAMWQDGRRVRSVGERRFR